MEQEPQHSDDLMTGFRTGDPQALEGLYSQHARSVVAYLAANTKCLSDAEDVSHIAWTKVWEKREQFKGGHFRRWLFTIARTTLIDFQRAANRRSTSELQDHEAVATDESFNRTERDNELRVMRDCMESLSERLFTVITKVKIELAAPTDVAEEIGTSRGQIDKDVHRAKKKLRDCMESKMK